MTSRQIWNRVFEIKEDLHRFGFGRHETFEFTYDEAATWFRNETSEIDSCRGLWLAPTNKANNEKGEGISIIRDAFMRGLIDICDTCPKLLWELENYIKDEAGRIPKENDHQIDNLRYHFAFIGYALHKENPPREPDPFLQKRALRIEDELGDNSNLVDFDHDYHTPTLEEF